MEEVMEKAPLDVETQATGEIHHVDTNRNTSVSVMESVDTTEHKPLPQENTRSRPYRQFRHAYFTVYRRLFAVTLVFNIIGWIVMETRSYDLDRFLRNISSAASANFCVAILARQEYIINGMFELYVLLIPKSAPLFIRKRVAKVYEFGGVHSGAAFCATFWVIRLVILLTMAFADHSIVNVLSADITTLVLAWILVVLFTGIVIFAYPALRHKAHDTFERTHRFAGWIAIALFWALVVLSANAIAIRENDPRVTGQVLVSLPSFWLLTLNTIHIVIPWVRLRKITVTAEPLSDKAVRLHLDTKVKPFYTIRLSDSPLSEWHSFACFPDSNGSTTSVIIAKAGDWTSAVIAEPKPVYWTRGLPTQGVLYMSLLFRRVVVVTTGSGIGPCLSLIGMKSEKRPACRVLWSTPNALETYGEGVINEVKECDPKAVLWNTKLQGRPDMVELTWKLVNEMDAEAVFVVSNPEVTKKVVYGMESRGIPAYGPVFDS